MLKVNNILFLLVFLFGYAAKLCAQDLPQMMTLFTTPEERQLINNNRYKSDKPVKETVPQVEPKPLDEGQPVSELIKEEINVTYRISGVTSNTEGSKTAWINGQAYESGDVMDDGSKIRINNSRVIITTPDGKSHTAVSGELLDLTYLQVIRE